MKIISRYMMPMLLASVPFLTKAQTVQLMMQDGTSTIINSNFSKLEYTNAKVAEDLATGKSLGISSIAEDADLYGFKVSFDFDKSKTAGHIVHKGLWYATNEDATFNDGKLQICDGDGAIEVKGLNQGTTYFYCPVVCIEDVIVMDKCRQITTLSMPSSCKLFQEEKTDKDNSTKTYKLTFQIDQYGEEYKGLDMFVALCSQHVMNNALSTGNFTKTPVTPDAEGKFTVSYDLDKSKYWEIAPVVEVKGEQFILQTPRMITPELNNNEFPTPGDVDLAYRALSGNLSSSSYYSSTANNLTYLLSSPYLSVIFPTNTATCDKTQEYTVLKYIDPLSVAFPTILQHEYYLRNNAVAGYSFQGTIGTDGNFEISSKTSTSLSASVAENRLYDLMRNLIITEDITRGDKEYYKTFGGSTIRVVNTPKGYEIQGGLQMEHNTSVFVPKESIYKRYTPSETESTGKNYFVIADKGIVPQPATKNLLDILEEKENNSECTLFCQLARQSSLFTSRLASMYSPYNKYNVTLFGSGDYTVLVPSDRSVQELISRGLLPSEDDYARAEYDYDYGDKIQKVIDDFIKSHVMQSSIYIGGTPQNNDYFDTFCLNSIKNGMKKLCITSDKNAMTVRDESGKKANVIMSAGMYNIPVREIWCDRSANTATRVNSANISSSAYVVVHFIDNVLYDGNANWRY